MTESTLRAEADRLRVGVTAIADTCGDLLTADERQAFVTVRCALGDLADGDRTARPVLLGDPNG